jgi:hypothetical protein
MLVQIQEPSLTYDQRIDFFFYFPCLSPCRDFPLLHTKDFSFELMFLGLRRVEETCRYPPLVIVFSWEIYCGMIKEVFIVLMIK